MFIECLILKRKFVGTLHASMINFGAKRSKNLVLEQDFPLVAAAPRAVLDLALGRPPGFLSRPPQFFRRKKKEKMARAFFRRVTNTQTRPTFPPLKDRVGQLHKPWSSLGKPVSYPFGSEHSGSEPSGSEPSGLSALWF